MSIESVVQAPLLGVVPADQPTLRQPVSATDGSGLVAVQLNCYHIERRVLESVFTDLRLGTVLAAW